MDDPFDTALASVEELRELYPPVLERAVRKDIGYFDELCRRLIGGASIVFLATHSADGHADVTPRGGQPGFVTVLDDHRLAIPDATGNQRLDSLANIVDSGRVGLIFVIGGRDTTLRVNGRACVSADPQLLDRLEPVGKPPRTAIVIEAEEVYAHCPKAFVRSKLWDPESWPEPESLPTPAEVSVAHRREPGLTVAAVEEEQRESLRTRLA
ncbi:MAG TPA: MSMEG_1061 family FMN-dependent PPOX-type flavoprotein [Thermoleophilaceae bacterium]|nr:MSMEG_1061 family FMN-dependent PPOX-type flavoprotein [Thermoleophilaceae bacterium]